MLPIEPKVGWVFRYSYLWHWQHLEGREEADKDRPALVLAIVATLEDGTPVVRRPSDHAYATFPPGRCRRDSAGDKASLGLDDERSWIVLTESNRFAWPGPDVRPLDTDSGYHGSLPPALFEEVKRRFVGLARSQRHQATPRSS